MSTHLSEAQLVGYVHRALTDAQREAMDQHLSDCPGCRVRLADHEALQEHIRRSLQADLRAAHPSPGMNLAAIAPRLKRPGKLVASWRLCPSLISGAAALVTVTVQAILLLALLGSVSGPVAGAALAPGRAVVSPAGGHAESTGVPAGTVPGHWSVDGIFLHNYEVGVDRTVAHTGQASGYVRSAVREPKVLWGHCSLMQRFRADDYRGRRLRMTAYVRTEAVEDLAVLWIRAENRGGRVLKLENLFDRRLRGTKSWQKITVEVDVPSESARIEFGVELAGRGRVWVDDFAFEVVP